MDTSNILYIGLKGQVTAINKFNGEKIWGTELPAGAFNQFVTLLVEDNHVYAHTGGELFCLDAHSGDIKWQNGLPGMGYDVASLAVVGLPSQPSEEIVKHQRNQAASSTSANAGVSAHGGV
ncbi:MAG: PQQ-binding-like beta-propeller repeat protein [Planctomycetota bacterium]